MYTFYVYILHSIHLLSYKTAEADEGAWVSVWCHLTLNLSNQSNISLLQKIACSILRSLTQCICVVSTPLLTEKIHVSEIDLTFSPPSAAQYQQFSFPQHLGTSFYFSAFFYSYLFYKHMYMYILQAILIIAVSADHNSIETSINELPSLLQQYPVQSI